MSNMNALKILYFARLREELGLGSEEIEFADSLANVSALASHLAARGGAWQVLAQNNNVRVAVNQDMADKATQLHAGDEVAFFPPVTGG
jgi:molybdopterin synthase sulfur carrier subunit